MVGHQADRVEQRPKRPATPSATVATAVCRSVSFCIPLRINNGAMKQRQIYLYPPRRLTTATAVRPTEKKQLLDCKNPLLFLNLCITHSRGNSRPFLPPHNKNKTSAVITRPSVRTISLPYCSYYYFPLLSVLQRSLKQQQQQQ